MEYSERTENLTKDDIKILKKNSNKMIGGLTSFMAFGIICGIIAKLISHTNGVLIAVGIIIVLPVSIILFLFLNFSNSDLKSGLKKIISGTIADKNIETVGAQNTDKTSNQDLYDYFYFRIGSQKITVTKEIFDKFGTGDMVEVHQTVSGQLINAYSLMTETENSADFFQSQIVPMTEEELALLIQHSKKRVNNYITYSFVFGFIGYWIVLGVSVALFAFMRFDEDNIIIFNLKWILIVLILIVIWFVNRKNIVNFWMDSRKKLKIIETVVVTDKLKTNMELKGNYVSIGGSKGYFYLKAKDQLIPVTEGRYNQTDSGLTILVRKSLHLKVILGVDEGFIQ